MKELGGCAAAIKSRSTDDSLDNDFFYLTGIREPGVVLTLAQAPGIPREQHGAKASQGRRRYVIPHVVADVERVARGDASRYKCRGSLLI